ncbi:hypothetical protein [Methylobacterium sp. P1-11]|uniref:hypothetical protein n=1 Tax=Methylobacterium sp. P1-11 TaxID=2024616 RepID=UPI0011EF2CEB|nr:hypothetical protein [Methylobacterium sp. P1-11]
MTVADSVRAWSANVRRDREIRRAARFVAWALADRSEFGRAGCRATDAEIAAELGVAENSVKNAILQLRSRGHIDWTWRTSRGQDIRTLCPILATDQLSTPHVTMDLAPIVGADTDPEHTSCESLNCELEEVAMTAPVTVKIVQDIRILEPSLTKERLLIPHAAIDLAPTVGAGTDPDPTSCEPLNRELEEIAMTAPAAGKVVQDIRTLGPTLSKGQLSIPHAAIGVAPSVSADTDLTPASSQPLNCELEKAAMTEPAAVKVGERRKRSRDGNRRREASVPFSEWRRDRQRAHVQRLIDRLPNFGWYARCSECGCEARAAFICVDKGRTFCRPHRRYAFEAVALAAFGLGPEDWAGRPECDGDFRGW